MDWAKAIERNRDALLPIVAALFGLLGLKDDTVISRIPSILRSAVLRVLRPAESAVRRLIFIAARDVVVKLAPARPMPAGLKRTGQPKPIPVFQLFDTRKDFSYLTKPKINRNPPRCWTIEGSPLMIALAARRPPPPAPPPKPVFDGTFNALPLVRRLQSLKAALDDIPRQAKRLVRLTAKRQAIPTLRLQHPMRPGQPPGHRRKPSHEIDEILTQCHWLAFEAKRPLRPGPS